MSPQPNQSGEFESPLAGALFMASFGIPQTPLIGKKPFLSDWPNVATTEPERIQEWYQEHHCNFGSVARKGGFFIFEADTAPDGVLSIRKRFEQKNCQFTSKSMVASRPDGSRGHRYYRWTEGIENIGQNATVYGDFSVRADAEQCVSPGSIHPDTGQQYKVILPFSAPALPTAQEIEFWKSEKKSKEVKNNDEGEPIVEGQRNAFLASQLGKIRQATGCGYDVLRAAAIDINNRRCSPPLTLDELEITVLKSIPKYPFKPDAFGERMAIKAQEQLDVLESRFERIITDPVQETSSRLVMPSSALASTRLQDIYSDIFQSNDWSLDLALPALVTAASVLVPRASVPEGQLPQGDDNLVNLFTGLIAPVHGGKSQVIEWAAKAMGIWRDLGGPHYLAMSAGSAEQLIDSLDRRKQYLKNTVLINPDEWAHLFAKANIPNASFSTFLTTSYYRRHQIIPRPRGKEVVLNLSMSFIGGIVEDEFDAVFNASALGGVYDRFLFGYSPVGTEWSYRPFPLTVQEYPVPILGEFWKPIPVTLDRSVFEVSKSWGKKGFGRITEICIRIATIYASMDGQEIVTGKDLEHLEGLAQYQLDIRKQFRPNAGLNPDAQFANAAIAWINKYAKNWMSIRDLKQGVKRWVEKLGPNVAERSLYALSRTGQIQLWMNTHDPTKNPPPADFNGVLPRTGLVRANGE